MKLKLNSTEWTTLFQSLENELRITEEADDTTDKDTVKWAEHLTQLKEKISKTLPIKNKFIIEVEE